MSVMVKVGKRELQGDELFSLLSGHNLWPQVMEAMVVDRALRTLGCSSEAVAGFYASELAADAAFLEKKRELLLLEGVSEEEVDFFVSRPLRLKLFKEQRFVPLLGSAFLKMKGSLDSVLFSMLRNRDHELTRELFFRLESGEESFDFLAARYAEGREAESGGRLGPMEMRLLHPSLARVLSTAQPGVVNPPVVIDGFGVITLLHEKRAARFDDAMKQYLVDQLFREWVRGEVQEFFY